MIIGELAKKVGVNPQTLRYYERKGLLPEPWRVGSGRYRMYGSEHEARLRFIFRAKELGFSLKEIEMLISLQDAPVAICDEMKAQAEAKVADIDRKIRDLRSLRRVLAKQIEGCTKTGTSKNCPMLAALED
ncbi:MerR family transcriptional regulator [Ruficoccus sp. ZRK36]|uniref:MerR family transcriptional regulator n=1 Tax=Ruficoccus sp. ZRK36 TaxID=2866311 RepID=UPI001C731A02|nr:MerR family transcriptional regulator [Ruficoccus sp. ZRK36]QYY35497.1 MerR family transcriptional regulator [Ruficoccus sp. ZRK36]